VKISFFSTSTRFSGGRLVMFRHANELARRGHDVRIWAQQTEPAVDWLPLHVPIHRVAAGPLTRASAVDLCVFDRARLASLLSLNGPTKVVHFCQGFEATDAELRIRSAWAQRGWFAVPEIWRLRRRLGAIDRAYRLPTVKVVTHRHLGELIGHRFGQSAYFVPCGLPAGVFTPPPQRSEPARTVLVVGPTDIGWKRVQDALRAVQLLKRQRPDIRLVRVAQHPMREVERDLAVTDEYHTMLRPPELAELYRKADVLLITSDATEGFGLPVLEAMACDLPCVVTDIPSFRTFAEPDDYAHFVPVGDAAKMAAAVGALLDSVGERKRLRARGLQVAADYTLQRSHDAMEAVLTEIALGQPPGPHLRMAASHLPAARLGSRVG
jgi:glycosyltransferase involved in cell wall biosynthesis